MNKKLLSILALVLMVCVLLVSCKEPEPAHEHTFDTASWSSDATMHWHKATCEHTSEMKDVQGHVDANIDGVCDVCKYAADHTHTYAETWSYDATGHWHVANCFHDVKSEVVAHTADGLGFCTECGYKVNDPDVSTVKKAVELGVAQKKTVKVGTITDSASESYIEFAYRNGYLYVNEGTTQRYYMLNGDGEIFAVAVYYGSPEADTLATLDNLNGPVIPTGFVGYADLTFYGTEDLVETLYAMASVDNDNGDFTESVAEGVYTFSFGYYVEYYGLYVIEVSFTLNETTYCFENVTITSKNYGTESITEVPGATAEDPSTYTINEGAEPTVYTVEIEQGIDVKNPYDPADLLFTSYDIVDAEGNVLGDTITIEQNVDTAFYFDNLLPESALWAFATVTFSGEGVNPEFDFSNMAAYNNGLHASFNLYEHYINLRSKAAVDTTYTLTVSVNGVAKTYTVKVVEAVPTEIISGQVSEFYGSTILDPVTSIEMSAGEQFVLGAHLDKAVGDIVFAIDGTTVNPMNYGFFSVWSDIAFTYVDGVSLSLSELAVGTHTVTISATANADLTVSYTVTVTEGGSTVGPEIGTGSGTDSDPFVIGAGDHTCAFPGGYNYVFYQFVAPSAGELTITMTSADYYWGTGSGAYMLENWGATFATKTLTVSSGEKVWIGISTNSATAAEVTFTVAFEATAGGEGGGDVGGEAVTPSAGDGSLETPFVITQSGTYNVDVTIDGYVYYIVNVTENGTISLSFEGNEWNYGYGTFNFDLCNGGFSPTANQDVTAGQTFYLKVSCYGVDSANITFTIDIPGSVEGGDVTPGGDDMFDDNYA